MRTFTEMTACETRRCIESDLAQGMVVGWVDDDLLRHALRMAVLAQREAAKAIHEVAAHLRNGGEFPMFADGEEGAKAADMLAAHHDEVVEQLSMLSVLIEEAHTVYLALAGEDDAA